MQTKIRIKTRAKDHNMPFVTTTSGGQDLLWPEKTQEESQSPPPAQIPNPSYDMGMKININHFKKLADPFVTGMNYFETLTAEHFKHETKARIIQKKPRKSRPLKLGPVKKRRNSASSDSSHSSSSSPGSSSPATDDCVEIYQEPGKGLRSRVVHVPNKRRFRIKNDIGTLELAVH